MKNFMIVVLMALVLTACDDGLMIVEGIDGESGQPGEDGEFGQAGEDGESGGEGVDGESGADGLDGESGQDGDAGPAGEDGDDGLDGMDGEPGPGTRTVYSGMFNTYDEATLSLSIDVYDMPSIQAWGYSDNPYTFMFGAGWYPAVTGVMNDGSLKIYLVGGAGNEYRVVVVE